MSLKYTKNKKKCIYKYIFHKYKVESKSINQALNDLKQGYMSIHEKTCETI